MKTNVGIMRSKEQLPGVPVPIRLDFRARAFPPSASHIDQEGGLHGFWDTPYSELLFLSIRISGNPVTDPAWLISHSSNRHLDPPDWESRVHR